MTSEEASSAYWWNKQSSICIEVLEGGGRGGGVNAGSEKLAGTKHVLGLQGLLQEADTMQNSSTRHASLTVDIHKHDKHTCYVWQKRLHHKYRYVSMAKATRTLLPMPCSICSLNRR